MSDIILSAGVRQNLLALQDTATLLSSTQNKLATGLKVNSALDNPNSFFTASNLNNRAGDLSSLLDAMGQSVQTLKAADEGIQAITKLVEAAKAKANQAAQTSDTDDITTFEGEYNALLRQIEDIAQDSSYNGKNLLAGTGEMTVVFNEKTSTDRNELDITGVDYTTAVNLGLNDAAWDITDITTIEGSLEDVTEALATLRSQASTFGTNLTVVENRQNFTMRMINTLEEGAGKLTLADTNKEGANLLALQTRQQLSSTALSMASQADQNVLRLF